MLFSLVVAGSLSAPPGPVAAAPFAPPPPAAAAALPRSRYYFVLFGGQWAPFVPRAAHTWAAFVRVTPAGDQVFVEPLTISWMPDDEEPRLYHMLTTPGKNCTLAETFRYMARRRARISYWGPYEIDAERFNMAAAQAARLQRGEVRYRVMDSLHLDKSVCHCAHAVTYADPNLKWLIQPVIWPGEHGTSLLAAMYDWSGAFVGGADATHDWLVPVLGIDRTAAVQRRPGQWIPLTK